MLLLVSVVQAFLLLVLFHCVGKPQFAYSFPSQEHLGYLQILVIMNKAAVNICILILGVWWEIGFYFSWVNT